MYASDVGASTATPRAGPDRRSRTCVAALLAAMAGLFPPGIAADQMQPRFDPFQGKPLRLIPKTTIQAGEEGGPDLTAPRAVLADSNHIYILDPAAFGVHRFDRQGKWLGMIGGQGEGPTEFRRPAAMGWMADTLWVADRRLHRLSFFDSDGDYLRSVGFAIISGPATIIPNRSMGSRRVVSVPLVPTSYVNEVDSLPVLGYDEDGSAGDTLAWRFVGRIAVNFAVSGNSGSRNISFRHPFDLRGMVAYDPLGRWLYVANWRTEQDGADHLELLAITSVGDTVAATRLPLGSVPVPSRAVRSYARRVYGGLPDSFRAAVSRGDFAKAFVEQIAHPAETDVDAMIAGEDGTVWFRRTDRTVAGPQRWVSYRPSEGFGGFVELPASHALLAVMGGALWTITEDDLGLPTLTEWAIGSNRDG